jgi:hypothetical protein
MNNCSDTKLQNYSPYWYGYKHDIRSRYCEYLVDTLHFDLTPDFFSRTGNLCVGKTMPHAFELEEPALRPAGAEWPPLRNNHE